MTTNRRTPDHEGDDSTAAARDERLSDSPSSGVQSSQKRRPSGWTVAGEFERDGFKYRLMRRPLNPAEDVPRLTRRESEAVAHAYDGCSNKRIAQLLGVSPSTVGVLLFRAASKLGVKSRRELIAAYERMILRSHSDD